MGIGNARARRACRKDAGLITPHGDRKPMMIDVAGSYRYRLITPHGDRKHGRGWRLSGAGKTPSLPLMGIGNATRSLLAPRRRAAHYPSWGSETRRPPEADLRQQRDSLPLMGIGNASGRVSPLLAPYRLITPHGDRKPEIPGRLDAIVSVLITPHGDRKPHRRRQDRGRCVLLITPHGDRKLGSEAPENVAERSLITPHGDRKL